MRQMTSVHSRTGLAFTALVEIFVSTITSLSVCALVGFKVTLVPWYDFHFSAVSISKDILDQGASTHCHCVCRRREHVQLGTSRMICGVFYRDN